jgi:hypothetical protein
VTTQEFWSGWWWPALTAILGFGFAWLVFAQWLKRRKPHQLAWSVGLLMYAAAALMEAVSEATGTWNPFVYRIYIVLAASLVGFLGLGTYYLMARKKTGPRIFLVYTLIAFAVFLVGSLTAELDMEKLVPGITVGGQALGPSLSFPRIMSLFFNIPGTILLLGGAMVSAYRFARKREYAYRMWANVLIATGTIVIAWAGSMARAGQTVGLYPAEMVASAILLSGFLLAGTLDKGTKEAIAHGQQRRAEEAATRTQAAEGTTN